MHMHLEELAGLLVHELVGLLVHVVMFSQAGDHTKNLPLWTKPTPLTLANHWASLSLFIFSSSALTQSLLVSALAAPAPTWAILSSKRV